MISSFLMINYIIVNKMKNKLAQKQKFVEFINEVKQNKFEISNALRSREDQKKLSKF